MYLIVTSQQFTPEHADKHDDYTLLHKHLCHSSVLFLSPSLFTFLFKANVFLARSPSFTRLDYLPAPAAKCVQAFNTLAQLAGFHAF